MVNEPSLLVICGIAFIAVMTLLAVLASVIRLLVALFPAETDDGDAAAIAAVHAAIAAAYPGSRVTAMEEIR
jgi:hypothetical protein